MILRQLIETINYSNEHLDSHSGQYDGIIKAIADDKTVGTLEYTEYNDDITISMIEVDKDFRGNKVGFNLIKELAKKYPYTKIIRGNLTADGEKLYKSTEKYFAPYIKKGKDEWGKNLLFKKYFQDDLSEYSKSEIKEILTTWDDEAIEIDDLDFFENIENIEDLLKQYKIKYVKTDKKIVITINDKLTDCLVLFKDNFPTIEPKYLNDYGDFIETLYNKLQD